MDAVALPALPVGRDRTRQSGPGHRPDAGAVRGVVRRARLDAAAAPGRAAGEGAGRALGAADRADRRGQDARRFPAEPHRPPRAAEEGPGRRPRHPHALHLAAEGARRRHRPQLGSAGRGDAVARAAGDAHRRYLHPQAPPPEAGPARHPADHAGAGGPASLRAGCRPLLRRPRHGDPRRAARARHQQARRPPVARPRPPQDTGAEAEGDRPFRHRRRPRRAEGLAGRAGGEDLLSRARDSTPSPLVGEGSAAKRPGRGGRPARNATPHPIGSRRSTSPSRGRWVALVRWRLKSVGGVAQPRRPRHRHRRRQAGDPHPGIGRAGAVGRALGPLRACRRLRRHRRPRHGAGLRQHPQPGRADLPGAVADQQSRPRHRPPPRLARRQPAPQGRGGDGGGQAARGGLHVHPRPRHRLGRRRSRHPRRRAEGREPARPAHRPRQPPPRRAVAGAAGARQPLRGAGMPRGARRQLPRRPGHAADPRRRPRRARPARPRHGLRGTVRRRRALSRGRLRLSRTATSTGRPSTASSISSPPAATR